MRPFIFSILILGMVTSCNTKNKDSKTLLNDIWVLETLDGQAISVDSQSERPQLEFNLAEKRFTGINGCNNIFGNIKEITNSKLILSDMASTRMACPDMELPNKFNQLFKDIRSYKIENLKLTLYGENNKELMQFKKVD